MNLIGTYKDNTGKLVLEITEADVKTGKLGGRLQVKRLVIGGPYVAEVEGHFHYSDNVGPGTSIAFIAYSDDLEGSSNYFAWAGFSKNKSFEELTVRGGESVVVSDSNSSAVESPATRFIKQ